MKRQTRLILLCCVAVALGSGCARRYVITTTTGNKVVTASKPRLVESRYIYKDATGETVEISALRVRLIEPYSKEAAEPRLQPDLLDPR
jgi:hypothetical protein